MDSSEARAFKSHQSLSIEKDRPEMICSPLRRPSAQPKTDERRSRRKRGWFDVVKGPQMTELKMRRIEIYWCEWSIKTHNFFSLMKDEKTHFFFWFLWTPFNFLVLCFSNIFVNVKYSLFCESSSQFFLLATFLCNKQKNYNNLQLFLIISNCVNLMSSSSISGPCNQQFTSQKSEIRSIIYWRKKK